MNVAGAARRWWGWARGAGSRPAVLLALAVLLWYAPVVLLGRVFFLKDAQLVISPSRLALRERLLALDIPEWFPELDLGMPFLASLDHGVLYPLNLLLLLPAPYCVGLFIVVHAVLAAVGAFALLRALWVGAAAAAFGALGFALGGYMVSLTWGTYYMMSLGWLPLVALLALGALREQSLASAAKLGLGFGCQVLVGEPQGAVLTLWLVLALALAEPGDWRRRLRGAGLLLLGLGIAACLAMPQILPTLEYLPRTRRAGGIELEQAQLWSLHPLRLGELLAPGIFGTPLRKRDFLGYFFSATATPGNRSPWMVTPYFGSLALVFAVVGAARPRRRHRGWVRALVALGAVTLLIALGRHTPVFELYARWVPGASFFRYPAKYFGLLAALLPMLAAAGVDGWRVERRARRWVRVVLGVALLALTTTLPFAPAIAAALQALRPEVALRAALAVVRGALVSELVVLGLLGLLLLGVRWRRRAGAVAVACLTYQLAWNNLGAYETAPPSLYAPPPLARELRARTPAGELTRVRHLFRHLPASCQDCQSELGRAELRGAILFRNTGVIHGIGYVRPYTSAGEAARRRLWAEASGWERWLLGLYGIRFVVLPSGTAPLADEGRRAMPIPSEGHAAAYEDRDARPFAFPAHAGVEVPDQETALRMTRLREVKLGWLVAIEGGGATAPPRPRAETPGSCRLVERPADALRIDCRLERPAWVVINESHHPHWRATLDGTPAELHRANALVMALEVPAGERRLRLEYREPSLRIGLLGTLAALVGSLLLLLGERRRRRAVGGA